MVFKRHKFITRCKSRKHTNKLLERFELANNNYSLILMLLVIDIRHLVKKRHY